MAVKFVLPAVTNFLLSITKSPSLARGFRFPAIRHSSKMSLKLNILPNRSSTEALLIILVKCSILFSEPRRPISIY